MVATVIWIGNWMPWRRPVSSMSPTARATAAGGSSSRPKVRARKKNSSESVDPSISGNSAGLDGQGQVALHGREVGEGPVVHPQPAAVAERDGSWSAGPPCRSWHGCARRPGRTMPGRTARAGCGRSRPAPCCGTPRASARRRTSRRRSRRRWWSRRPAVSACSAPRASSRVCREGLPDSRANLSTRANDTCDSPSAPTRLSTTAPVHIRGGSRGSPVSDEDGPGTGQ